MGWQSTRPSILKCQFKITYLTNWTCKQIFIQLRAVIVITWRVTLKERRLVELIANVKLNTLSHFRHIKEQLTIAAHYWECIDTTRSGSIRKNIHTLVTCNTTGTYFQASCIIHFTVTGFVTATTLVLLTVGLKAHGKWVRPWWWFRVTGQCCLVLILGAEMCV